MYMVGEPQNVWDCIELVWCASCGGRFGLNPGIPAVWVLGSDSFFLLPYSMVAIGYSSSWVMVWIISSALVGTSS